MTCICLCFHPRSSAQAVDPVAFCLGDFSALISTAALPLVFSLGLLDGISFVIPTLASCISTEKLLVFFFFSFDTSVYFSTKQCNMTRAAIDSKVVGKRGESFNSKWRDLLWLYQDHIPFPLLSFTNTLTDTCTHRELSSGRWEKEINISVRRMNWLALGLLSYLCICLLVCKDHKTKGLSADPENVYLLK